MTGIRAPAEALKRLIGALGERPIATGTWILSFLAVICLRNFLELFYVPELGTQHHGGFGIASNTFLYLHTTTYFYSLILSVMLIMTLLTRVPFERVARVTLPFTIVILLPALDMLFYPNHSMGEKLYVMILGNSWPQILANLREQLFQLSWITDPSLALGLRIEVGAIHLLIWAWLLLTVPRWWQALWKLPLAYWAFQTSIVLHELLAYPKSILYGHQADAYIAGSQCYLALIALQGLLAAFLCSTRSRSRFGAFILPTWCLGALAAWELGLLVSLRGLPFTGDGFAILRVVLAALAVLGLVVMGRGMQLLAQDSMPTGLERESAKQVCWFCAAFSLLAAYLVIQSFFAMVILIMGLAWLAWASPWPLAKIPAAASLLAGLALMALVLCGYLMRGTLPIYGLPGWLALTLFGIGAIVPLLGRAQWGGSR